MPMHNLSILFIKCARPGGCNALEYHKYRMMDDLGIKSLAELVRYAVKHSFTAP
jgi:hypothetical protein